jgi:branched-chain amino acid transport system substrate-binding protein
MRFFPKYANWVIFFLMLTQLMAGCSMEKTSIALGFIGGISGGNSDLGQPGRNGAMLAVEEANRTGGVNGRSVELVILDDADNVKKAKAAARDLIKKKVEAMQDKMRKSFKLPQWALGRKTP